MLQLNNVTLMQGQQPLLRDVSFTVRPGEIVTLMGPSGCGKSTLFSWMIGALPCTFQARGELWLNNSRIDKFPTEQRRIGIRFQDALLFDHLSVGHNLQLALPAAVRGGQRKDAVHHALAQAGLHDFYTRDPATLSGGQRASVALLRALLAQPNALLLDEPFSRLDSTLRVAFRQWVFDTLIEQNIPTILVTHDQADVPENASCMDMMRWHETV